MSSSFDTTLSGSDLSSGSMSGTISLSSSSYDDAQPRKQAHNVQPRAGVYSNTIKPTGAATVARASIPSSTRPGVRPPAPPSTAPRQGSPDPAHDSSSDYGSSISGTLASSSDSDSDSDSSDAGSAGGLGGASQNSYGTQESSHASRRNKLQNLHFGDSDDSILSSASQQSIAEAPAVPAKPNANVSAFHAGPPAAQQRASDLVLTASAVGDSRGDGQERGQSAHRFSSVLEASSIADHTSQPAGSSDTVLSASSDAALGADHSDTVSESVLSVSAHSSEGGFGRAGAAAPRTPKRRNKHLSRSQWSDELINHVPDSSNRSQAHHEPRLTRSVNAAQGQGNSGSAAATASAASAATSPVQQWPLASPSYVVRTPPQASADEARRTEASMYHISYAESIAESAASQEDMRERGERCNVQSTGDAAQLREPLTAPAGLQSTPMRGGRRQQDAAVQVGNRNELATQVSFQADLGLLIDDADLVHSEGATRGWSKGAGVTASSSALAPIAQVLQQLQQAQMTDALLKLHTQQQQMIQSLMAASSHTSATMGAAKSTQQAHAVSMDRHSSVSGPNLQCRQLDASTESFPSSYSDTSSLSGRGEAVGRQCANTRPGCDAPILCNSVARNAPTSARTAALGQPINDPAAAGLGAQSQAEHRTASAGASAGAVHLAHTIDMMRMSGTSVTAAYNEAAIRENARQRVIVVQQALATLQMQASPVSTAWQQRSKIRPQSGAVPLRESGYVYTTWRDTMQEVRNAYPYPEVLG